MKMLNNVRYLFSRESTQSWVCICLYRLNLCHGMSSQHSTSHSKIKIEQDDRSTYYRCNNTQQPLTANQLQTINAESLRPFPINLIPVAQGTVVTYHIYTSICIMWISPPIYLLQKPATNNNMLLLFDPMVCPKSNGRRDHPACCQGTILLNTAVLMLALVVSMLGSHLLAPYFFEVQKMMPRTYRNRFLRPTGTP